MRPGDPNQVDRIAAATPQGERVLPSLPRQQQARTPPQTSSSVMNTLLGQDNLSAMDAGGSDPYNTTGRHFRR